ncbi:MAG: UDP-N-acetylmuramoyl-L-alanine--D-glutamate ligase, partial [Planctomycetes bacterium]|nr:UDP-N-acetylmuramoyl-L-alanine--D-glutamate ligase [Planctomycetota bacterium]
MKYNFAAKKVLIMGLGRFGGGADVAEFAARAGAKVIVTDLAPAAQLSDSIGKLEEFPDIEFHLGSHDQADFKQADIIIANPAVPCDNEFLEIARRDNKFITSQINIFFELCPAQIIGITGANGKSTTTALTAHLLKNTIYENVWLSGNIGNQPLLTVIEKIAPDDLVVLE